MDWREALSVVVARTGHRRYEWLCSDEHPHHEGVRALMLKLAAEEAPGPAAVAKSPPTEADLALREYLEQHGCGPCH